ncbi:MAG: nicotinamide riboside transporter PnuC [Gemmataceae bacterium]|nr:nicotinamide riboside transporter PnuC [Gemmataceae bacterium]
MFAEQSEGVLLGLSPGLVAEIVASALGLVSVWLTVRQSVWCWPVGVGMVVLSAWVFWEKGLHANAGLQGVYFVLQFYGWYTWLHGGRGDAELPVSRASPGLLGLLAAMGVAGTAALTVLLPGQEGLLVTGLDSGTTAFSLVAQWMLARKLLESWLFWVAVDTVAVPLFAFQGLWWFAGLYAVFWVLAVAGFLEWRRSFLKSAPNQLQSEPEA